MSKEKYHRHQAKGDLLYTIAKQNDYLQFYIFALNSCLIHIFVISCHTTSGINVLMHCT